MQTNNAIRFASPLAWLIAVAPVALTNAQNSSPPPAASPADLTRLANEVFQLKADVLQMSIEATTDRLALLQRELGRGEETLRWLTAEEGTLQNEVEDLQRQLEDPALSTEQRSEIAATASEASTNGAAWLSEQRAAAEQRDATLRGQLTEIEHTRAQLLARAAELGLTRRQHTRN
jgi:chromosome segregation ATPase